jgi:hypothetical protein
MWTRNEHVKNSMFKIQQVLTDRSVAYFLFEVFTVRGKHSCVERLSVRENAVFPHN